MPTKFGGVMIVAGVCLALADILVHYGFFAWFGRLPGDIRLHNKSVNFYFPLTSMLLISAGISLVSYLIRRFF